MPGRKRPTDEDAATARRALLDGLARGADIFEVLRGLASLHPRNDTFPGEVFLHLAAAAVHGGTEPDLLEEVAYWQTDDFWQYSGTRAHIDHYRGASTGDLGWGIWHTRGHMA